MAYRVHCWHFVQQKLFAITREMLMSRRQKAWIGDCHVGFRGGRTYKNISRYIAYIGIGYQFTDISFINDSEKPIIK